LEALSMKTRNFILGVLTLLTASTSLAEANLLKVDRGPIQALFLQKNADALQARVDIIQQAQSEILVEYFMVRNDEQALGAMSLLVEAAKRGVKVKVILDSLYSYIPSPMYRNLLEKAVGPNGESNLEIRLYNPFHFSILGLTHRDHAKSIVIDNNILLTGGRNVGGEYFGFNKKRNLNDLDILVKGPLASIVREDFLRMWQSEIVKAPMMNAYSEERLQKNSCVLELNKDFETCENQRQYARHQVDEQGARLDEVIQQISDYKSGDSVRPNTNTDWFKKSVTIHDYKFLSHRTTDLVTKKTATLTQDLVEVLKLAKTDVNIISPYLIPTEEVFDVFQHLIENHVRVRIITNSLKSTDNLIAQAGYRDSKERLVKMGVEIYEYNGPDTVHAKTALIDGHLVLIGTFNIDPRSGFINREIVMALDDKYNVGLASEEENIIDSFRSNSTLVAKDGRNFNLEWQAEGLTLTKKLKLILMKPLMPILKPQS
jgi:putative cardiolipin synthase